MLWALSITAAPYALVRGHQLDGDHEVRFDDGPHPAAEKLLLPSPDAVPLDGGWVDFPGYTRLAALGCYGYQIDTPTETTTIIFRAVEF